MKTPSKRDHPVLKLELTLDALHFPKFFVFPNRLPNVRLPVPSPVPSRVGSTPMRATRFNAVSPPATVVSPNARAASACISFPAAGNARGLARSGAEQGMAWQL